MSRPYAGRRAGRRRVKRDPDYILFYAVAGLLLFGLVMVFSASAVRALSQFGDRYFFLERQLVWTVMGLGSLIFFMNVDYSQLKRWALPVLVVGMVCLVLVLIPGVGRVALGARRWLGPFQPSELFKPVIVLFLAASLSERGEQVRKFVSGLLPYLVLTALVFGLILAQPNLGTGVAIAGTMVLMLFMAGSHLAHLFGLGLASAPVLVWAIFSEDYRRRRFFAHLDPWADPTGAGWQIIQSLYALGSGRLLGMGVGYGRQKYLYLPEPHTDFIFSVLGEELGFLGTATVVVLFGVLAWRGYRVATSAPDRFGCLLAGGLTAMITLQALMNLGVVTASIPITGIPLPLLSYGGSSMLFTLSSIGIIMSVSRYTAPSGSS